MSIHSPVFRVCLVKSMLFVKNVLRYLLGTQTFGCVIEFVIGALLPENERKESLTCFL